jgi:hypothetical protein
MLRELAKTVIPRGQWAATYVDTMPTRRHISGYARWGGIAVFGVFWMIGDDSFKWLAGVGAGEDAEGDE